MVTTVGPHPSQPGLREIPLRSHHYAHLKATGGANSAEMLADEAAGLWAIGDTVHTAAYREGSQFGGCTYRVVAAATGTDDGGSYITVGSVQLEAVFDDELDVTQFGATFTDAGPAANAACQWLKGRGGGILRFRAGEWITSVTIDVPTMVRLVGDGHGSTRIKLADNSGQTAVIRSEDFATFTGTGAWFVDTQGVNYGFGVESMTVDGNRSTNPTSIGVQLYGKNYIIDDLFIANTGGIGFYSECGTLLGAHDERDSPESTIGRLWIRNAGGIGFNFRGPHDTIIDELIPYTCGDWGALFESGPNYDGHAVISKIHTYNNADFKGIRATANVIIGTLIDDGTSSEFTAGPSSIDRYHTITTGKTRDCLTISGSQVRINQALIRPGIAQVGGLAALRISGNNCTISSLQIDATNRDYDAVDITGDNCTIDQANIRECSQAGRYGIRVAGDYAHIPQYRSESNTTGLVVESGVLGADISMRAWVPIGGSLAQVNAAPSSQTKLDLRSINTGESILAGVVESGVRRDFDPGSAGGGRFWVRLFTIDGVNNSTGGHCSGFLSGVGDYGVASRGTVLIHAAERAGVFSLVAYLHGVTLTADRVRLHYVPTADPNTFDVWAQVADFNQQHGFTLLAGEGHTIRLDSFSQTAPTSTVEAVHIHAVTGKGATASRPTLTASDTGFQFFDTTLGYPIWWNGTGWIDANGVAV